jgi:putative transposase
LIPKYRGRLLQGKISIRLKNLMCEAFRINGWWICALSIMEDHVHMIVQVLPSQSVADVVQIFKGGTSRLLRKEFPELTEFLWGESFWADGYFAETVGQVNEELVKKYIHQQRKGL